MLRDQIIDMMKKLELYGMIEKYDEILEKAQKNKMSNEQIFHTLIDVELAYRENKGSEKNLK